MRNSPSTTRGFSLIEMLVYVSVMVILAGALIASFLSLNTTYARNATERALMRGAQTSLERMTRDIMRADGVNVGLSSLDTSLGALAVTESATTTRFYVSGDALMVSVNGVEQGPLTSDVVSVEDVVFHRFTSSTTDMVRVTLTLSAVSRVSSSTRTFYTSAVLRGTYE